MTTRIPREYIYKQGSAVLKVGIDDLGRVYSTIMKNDRVVMRDVFIRIPTEVELAKQGWTRKQDE